MKARELPSQDYLKECLTYFPETGKLYWKARPQTHFKSINTFKIWNSKFSGKETSTYTCGSGYPSIRLDNRKYSTHRVIWKLVYGEDPEDIDHINGNKLDSRLINFRSVSHQENHKNQKKPKNNSTGTVGIYWNKALEKWQAKICVFYKQKHLGYFDNFEKAVAVRKAAELEYGYHPNHGKERVT